MADKKIICPICKKERVITKGMFWFIKTGNNTGRCISCSLKRNKYRLGTKQSKDTRKKMSSSSLGKKKSLEHRENISKGKKGKNLTLKHRVSLSLAHTKEKEFFGFENVLQRRIRGLGKYLEWRSNILKRDNYHCQNCGNQENLEVHHIIPFFKILNKFKIRDMEEAIKCDGLWEIGNGITYCRKCHIKIDGNIGFSKSNLIKNRIEEM